MDEKTIWSILLMFCWIIVSLGQINQGMKIKKNKNIENISIFLPTTVFIAQTILFVKGLSYGDWSLIIGAVVVNIGTMFNVFNFLKIKPIQK